MTDERAWSRRQVLSALPVAAVGTASYPFGRRPVDTDGADGASRTRSRARWRSRQLTISTAGREASSPTSVRRQARLVADDATDGDEFGWSVSVDGDTTLVGAPEDTDPNGEKSGSAYVFVRDGDTWTQQAKLTPDDGDSGEYFGSAVSLDGDTALVAAVDDEDPNGVSSGAVYVFGRDGDTWSQQAKLAPDDGDEDDFFGTSVALSGGTALVGAFGDEDPNGGTAGSAYVFVRDGGSWTRQAKLAPADGDRRDGFGISVALAGDTALVGANGDEDPNGSTAGAAYVFVRDGDTWSQQAKLASDDGDSGDYFGTSVTLDGGTAIVGAHRDEDPNGAGAGSAYVFAREGDAWTQQAKLAPADGDSADTFGTAASLAGDTALVGADGDEDPNGAGAGSAYVFVREDGTWHQRANLAPDEGDDDDHFGGSVALDSDTALVGANGGTDANGKPTGAAYVYSLSHGGSGSNRGSRTVPTTVPPGGSVTVTLEATATGGTLSFSEQFEPAVASANVTSVTVDGSEIDPVVSSANGNGVVVTLDGLTAGDAVTVEYTVSVADDAALDTTYRLSGSVTRTETRELADDTLTVVEGTRRASVVTEYDSNADGTVSIDELGQAAADFTRGKLSIDDLGRIAAAFAHS